MLFTVSSVLFVNVHALGFIGQAFLFLLTTFPCRYLLSVDITRCLNIAVFARSARLAVLYLCLIPPSPGGLPWNAFSISRSVGLVKCFFQILEKFFWASYSRSVTTTSLNIKAVPSLDLPLLYHNVSALSSLFFKFSKKFFRSYRDPAARPS